jgi:hypothetical protein
MSFNILDTSVSHLLSTWTQNPGWWISMNAKSSEVAHRIFSNFIEKRIPEAQKLIGRLIQMHHITEVHLPMEIEIIFFIYLEELIERYQIELGPNQRDTEIDQELQVLKQIFAKESYLLLTQNHHYLDAFIGNIQKKLAYTRVLPDDFDATITLWKGILCIANLPDMELGALFETKVRTRSLTGELKSLPTQIPRRMLEKAFRLVLHQVSRDFEWIVSKIEQKLRPIEDEAWDVEMGFCLCVSITSRTACALFQACKREQKECLEELVSLDLKNNAHLKPLCERLEKMRLALKRSLSNIEHALKIYDEPEQKVYKIPDVKTGKTLSVSREILLSLEPHLRNYQECHLLQDRFLSLPLVRLMEILDSLYHSNEAWDEFEKGGKKPLLASNIPSLLPTLRIYDEKCAEELLADELTQQAKKKKAGHPPATSSRGRGRGKQKRGGARQVGKKQPSEAPPPKPKNRPSKSPVPLPQEPPLQDSFERLIGKLMQLHQIDGSPALRQGWWHLEMLATLLQDSLGRSSPQGTLNIIDLAASSAQKVIEQLSVFVLEKRGIALKTHHLKQYHQALAPDTPYPPIIELLYHANEWSRYFYPHQERWLSFSTQNVDVPPLLNLLVAVAEGQKKLSPAEREKWIKELIQGTCAYAETLLSGIESPRKAVSLIRTAPVQSQELQNVEAGALNTIGKELQAFLSKSSLPHYHPATLQIKQALAALTMLQMSLQQIKGAQNVREVATWTSRSVQQLQESVENVLHTIEFFRYGSMSIEHELGVLSEKVGLDMGPLKADYDHLSHKSRYPVETQAQGKGSEIIDAVEALKCHPELLEEGYHLPPHSTLLWSMPHEDVSLHNMLTQLSELITSTETFLREQALPALEACLPSYT